MSGRRLRGAIRDVTARGRRFCVHHGTGAPSSTPPPRLAGGGGRRFSAFLPTNALLLVVKAPLPPPANGLQAARCREDRSSLIS